jgi:NAD+-dependent secondary alcohol dehydrogenase Adh1
VRPGGITDREVMKAIRLRKQGSAPTVEEVPEPGVSDPLDVLIEIGAAGLCRTDLELIQGRLAGAAAPLPRTLGHENAGWVRDIGSGVRNLKPGDTVIVHPAVTCGLCRPCRSADEAHCERLAFTGLDVDGGLAELLVTNVRSVVKLRSGLPPEEIATLAHSGLTAFHTVREASPLLHPGTSVVVLGAGRLGRLGLQCLLALSPTEVVVVDMSDHDLDAAADLGAHHIVQAGPGQVSAVGEVTGGGAHVVLDFTEQPGNEATGMAMLRRAGSYFLAGSDLGREIPPAGLVTPQVNVMGNFAGSHNDLADLMTIAAERKIELGSAIYGFESFPEMLDDLSAGTLSDWAVLAPASG